MENNRHTPIPWYIEGESGNPHEAYIIVGDKQGSTIAWTSNSFDDSSNEEYISEEDTANAQFIIRACNSHDELLEALESVLSFDVDEAISAWEDPSQQALAMAHKAIAKAKGE
jgi:hypothetical protein